MSIASNRPPDTFLAGGITVPLIKFAVPLALALVVQALYGAVDLMIVGQLGETADVAAVGTGSLILQALTATITGLAMGITVRIGHAVGANNPRRAARTLGGALKLFTGFGIVTTIAMMVFAETLAHWMAAPPEAFARTVSYVRIGAAGTLFVVIYNVVAGVFRGLGDSRSPLAIVSVACVLNIVGDLYFVGVLHMGAPGAAYATVIAQGCGAALSWFYLKKKQLPFRFDFRSVRFSGNAVRGILKIGLPVAAQDLLNYLSFMVLAAIINSLGLIASAAMGIEGKVFAFFVLVPVSFMSALSTFVAQNIGAGQEERAILALRRSMVIAFLMGVISFALTFWHGELLAGIFEKNPETVTATARLLKGASFEHLLYPFVFCFLGYFNGKALTVFILLEGLICAMLVRIPLAYCLSRSESEDLFPVGLALSASATVGFLLCVWYYLHQRGMWQLGFAAGVRRMQAILNPTQRRRPNR